MRVNCTLLPRSATANARPSPVYRFRAKLLRFDPKPAAIPRLAVMRATRGEEAMAAFSHVTVGTNDLAKARAFYDSVLAPLGMKRLKDLGDKGSCWGQSIEEFLVLTPGDGKPACPANGGTVSFEAPSRAAVAAFHKAALAAGGKDEGAVGPRGFWPNA